MYTIELNPKLKIELIEQKKIVIINDKHQFIISGDLITKYFIDNLKYYISPISVDLLYYQLGDLNNWDNINYEDYISVINMLVKKEILIVRNQFNKCINVYKKLDIDILDYTNQHVSDNIKLILQRYVKTNGLDSLITCNYYDIFKGNYKFCTSKYNKIIIPIFWIFNIGEFETLKFNLENDTILPIICNYSYFSIGPRIYDAMSWDKAQKILSNEMRRYSYWNYEPSDEYAAIMASFLVQEIRYIYEEMNEYKMRSRTNEEIITYNFNSYTVDIKKYIF